MLPIPETKESSEERISVRLGRTRFGQNKENRYDACLDRDGVEAGRDVVTGLHLLASGSHDEKQRPPVEPSYADQLFTERGKGLLDLAGQGLSNDEIEAILGLPEKTAAPLFLRFFQQLGVPGRRKRGGFFSAPDSVREYSPITYRSSLDRAVHYIAVGHGFSEERSASLFPSSTANASVE